ncbi:MAG TPA: exodeoxyribonuclease V subunit gamma, partial [Spirochaetota bacterium]|nr:exodeoxyribonuclease V subunit gamma [Spirochaetota bacterium]
GMERWISMRLAEHLGIWANCIYPFPNTMIYGLFRDVLGLSSGEDPFDKAVMTWKVLGLLEKCTGEPGFESLKIYAGDTVSPLKQYQLARQIADVFDQYLTYRPDMMLRWDSGEGEHWQANLWRKTAGDMRDRHRVALRDTFFRKLEEDRAARDLLPKRLSLFGVATLPPFHLDFLDDLSAFVPVHMFFLNPSRQYWGDLRSRKELSKAEKKLGRKGIGLDEQHYDTGNSLLVSMGTLGRFFLDMIYDKNPMDSAFPDSWVEPARDTLLHRVQHDILDAVDRGQLHNMEREEMRLFPETAADVEEIGPEDESIRIHSCHSPMREIEVLHDYLLNCFDTIPGLEPRDILVMAPDIETYVPHIDTVFGSPEDDSVAIPYTIADRTAAGMHRAVRTFLSIASIGTSRLGAGEVLDILSCPEVLRRFSLDESDLPLLRKWTAETGIRWGIDAGDRLAMGLPSIQEHTWRSGMERLLLGYAMPGEEERLFRGILPYDHVEGARCEVLGGYLEFLESLFMVKREINENRSPGEWSAYLIELGDRFFEIIPGDSERSLQTLRNELETLKDQEDISGFKGKVPHAVIAAWLNDTFGSEPVTGSFLRGGVTFCAMLPMRSIPFKVICLVGMNDDTFPHPDNAVSFNLMKDDFKPGDRSRRHDDRYIFLETIISARERLCISFVGQSIRDNSEIPPSVAVSELMDYINQGYRIEGGMPGDRILVQHRLQPFSAGYFTGKGPLFSYSGEQCRAAGALMDERLHPEPFISAPLPEVDNGGGDIDLRDFLRFFRNPAQFLLETRLRMFFHRRSGALDEREPFDIDGLEAYAMKDDISRRILGDSFDGGLFDVYRAGGKLPHGTIGEHAFNSICQASEMFAESIRDLTMGNERGSLDIETIVRGRRFTGTIDDVWPGGVIYFRPAQVKPYDMLRGWIVRCILTAAGDDREVYVAGTDAVRQYDRRDPEEILGPLIALYDRGLREPVPLLPQASFACAGVLKKNPGDRSGALSAARKKWEGEAWNGSSDADDPCMAACFGGLDIFNDEFLYISEIVYLRMLDAMNKKE